MVLEASSYNYKGGMAAMGSGSGSRSRSRSGRTGLGCGFIESKSKVWDYKGLSSAGLHISRFFTLKLATRDQSFVVARP